MSKASVLGPKLFTIFINEFDARIEIRLADTTELKGSANTFEETTKIQRDLVKLEKWAIDNKINFTKYKCKELDKGKKMRGDPKKVNNFTVSAI